MMPRMRRRTYPSISCVRCCNKIGELYSDKLKGWWEKFGKAMEDNDLTEAERNALRTST